MAKLTLEELNALVDYAEGCFEDAGIEGECEFHFGSEGQTVDLVRFGESAGCPECLKEFLYNMLMELNGAGMLGGGK